MPKKKAKSISLASLGGKCVKIYQHEQRDTWTVAFGSGKDLQGFEVSPFELHDIADFIRENVKPERIA